MKNKILILIIILSFSVSGCFLNTQEKSGEVENNQKNTQKEENIPENIDILNWQTYRNEEYGFEFKYSKNRKIKAESNSVIYIYNPSQITSHGSIKIEIKNNLDNLTLKEYYKNLSETSDILIPNYFEISNYEYKLIDSVNSVQFDSIPTPPAPIMVTRTSIPIKNAIVEIDLSKRTVEKNGEEEYIISKNIYDNILKNLVFYR